MHAVYLTGHGGFEKLDYRTDVPVPSPRSGEVLIKVAAAGVNNTDINTRIGWYSKTITSSTSDGGDGFDTEVESGGWDGALSFPRIQGADVTGTIVSVGVDVDTARVGDRVVCRSMQNLYSDRPTLPSTMGSEFDGGFAQYCVVRSDQATAVTTDLSDVELGSLPCAYSTAEGLLQRIRLTASETVLITGASGGVGSAGVQLAKLRGATVIAVASAAKADQLIELGADRVVARGTDLVEELGSESVDCVADVVAGDQFPSLLEVLRRQGRYGTSGAIAGPIVELDVRTLYLKDLDLVGSTHQPDAVWDALVGYIETGALRPLVTATFPLHEIVEAQRMFLSKEFVGKIVLIPPL